MSLLIVKNISREGPGLLQKILDENDIHHDIIDLETGEEFPEPEGYSALMVFGGPDSANDTTEKMTKELEMIGRAIDSGIPYLGICLGMQALVKTYGGSVLPNDIKEIGFRGEDGKPYSIDIENKHTGDPLFNGIEGPLKIFHLHGETVTLTEDMQLLATGKYCRHQIVKVGEHAYGIQGHFELTPEMFTLWLDNDPELMEMDRDELQKDFELFSEEYCNTGRKLFTNFLKMAGLL
ncbi:type 1 glutamine amidotransferase [Methanolobus sp. WCC4]|uniref:type 1 glutamine amidotransferase n=1 Tax=Methanolobus sp. WCC4 TaxID=3125784 RepID=UPI0030FBB4EF